MKIFDKETKEEVIYKNRRAFMLGIGSWIMYDFYRISEVMDNAIEQYKDAEIVPYVKTPYDITLLRTNPDHIWNIPDYHIPEFDNLVSSTRFEQKIRNELYARWLNKDIELIELINNTEDCPYFVEIISKDSVAV